MAGIEKIIDSIKSSADAEAAAIISDAEKKAEEFLEKARKECVVYTVEENARSDKKIELAGHRYGAQSEQAAKLIKLKAKQNIIENVINKALNKLENAEAEDYFDYMLKLIGKAAESGDGVLFMSDKDLKRIPKDFPEKAAKAAADKGGTLKVSDKPAAIESGFILKYGQIEENYSLKALFEENHDRLQDIVNSILWG